MNLINFKLLTFLLLRRKIVLRYIQYVCNILKLQYLNQFIKIKTKLHWFLCIIASIYINCIYFSLRLEFNLENEIDSYVIYESAHTHTFHI